MWQIIAGVSIIVVFMIGRFIWLKKHPQDEDF